VIREQGEVRHADGSALTWLFYSAPIRPLADGRQLIVTMASDVTEIKQALASAEKASRAKDEFLAVMSHELRTPLNPVVGLTDLLLHGEKDPDKLEMLEMVRQSAHGLLKLIDNILDYTHIDLGRFQINPEEESLREMIFEVVDVVRDGFERKGLTLNINGDGCAELWDEPVVTDPRRVRQILEHLLSNALKFTPRGNVDILASLDLTGDSSATAHIAVRDTGIGISADDKERILAPFHQADSSSTREFGGTGLGLAICCRILEGLQGKLHVESTPGIGSTFTVSIPVSLPELPEK
jgi:signal transduction histidine kinase